MSYLVEFKENEPYSTDFAAETRQEDIGPRVLIIEDMHVERECLAKALAARHPKFQVTTFESKTAIGTGVRADVVLVGFDSIEADGRHAGRIIGSIQERFPNVPVVILAEDAQKATISADLFGLGVSGCLSYADGIDGLTKVLWLVLNGGACFPRESICNQHKVQRPAPAVQIEVAPSSHESADNLLPEVDLTDREQEVVRQLRLGKPNKIIAYELGISISTVKVHVRNIMRKTGATNRVEAALLPIGQTRVPDKTPVSHPSGGSNVGAHRSYSLVNGSGGELCTK